MKKFIVDEKLFEVSPNYCVGIVVCNGIDNHIKIEEIYRRLDEEIEKFSKDFGDLNVREIKSVSAYRDAFRKLSINPNKYMCSIESLLKRVQKNKSLPVINSIVDMGNLFSVKYRLPLGAHDISKMEGDFEIRFSKEEDSFLPMGGEEKETADKNELVYVSNNTIKTRRWMWRQSEDGKITEETSDVFFPIDGFVGVNEDEVIKLRDELSDFIEKNYGLEVKKGYVDSQNREFEII